MDRARVAVLVAGAVTAAASVAAIVAAATSSDSDAGGASVGTVTTAEASASLAIEIRDFAFGPEAPTVAPGTQVVWTNNDAVTHSIRSADGTFDSPDIGGGETFTAVFTTPGTYEYVCGIHDTMHGSIIVEG